VTTYALLELIWRETTNEDHLKKISHFLGRVDIGSLWNILRDGNFTAKAYDSLDKISILVDCQLQCIELTDANGELSTMLAMKNSKSSPFALSAGLSTVDHLCYFNRKNFTKFTVSNILDKPTDFSTLAR